MRMSPRSPLFCFGLTLLMLTSCAVGPNYIRSDVGLSKNKLSKTTLIASKYGKSQHFVHNMDIPAQWWTLFHSKPLNDLVEESLKNNPTVMAARATLKASFEQMYASIGSFYPAVGLSFSQTVQQSAKILTSVLANNQYNYALYTGQLYVSYTPDVFGGTRRQVESSAATAGYQQFQLEATYLTLSSNVVNAAIQEASLRAQIAATQKIITCQTKTLSILKRQLILGDASEADLATFAATLAQTEATLPPLQRQLALHRDLLNALIGRFPDDQRTPMFHFHDLTLPTDLPLALPSALLEHRPDIRAAEEQMKAANALIGVAIANRLPNVSIGASNAGTSAVQLSGLLGPNSQFWALAGLVAAPIFQGGTLLHKQRFAEAQYETSAALYRLTIINAFQNVADTLKTIQSDARTLNGLSKAERAAFKSLSISRDQHAMGDSSILDLLFNEQLHQQARIKLIQAEANRLTDTVALFQALGGGWWNT
ncbi:MAG: efflux transporter outer membrane subunit [Legionellales bacterium]|nr:efflux transporter outer membrane subunit [Legionellales bacterium]